MISVIIIVFNRPREVQDAVRSVLAQDGLAAEGLEVIVVDDHSSPRLDMANADPRLKVIRLPSNVGPAGARNAGIRASRGDYLAFLDSDDIWLPDKLSLQLGLFRKLEATHAASSLALVSGFYYPGHQPGELEARVPQPASRTVDFASGCWFCPGSTLFLHRSAYARVGLLDDRVRRLEDLDWFVRFGQRGGQLHVLPQCTAVIAPSTFANLAIVAHCTAHIARKFGPRGEVPLPAEAYRRLQSYLELERAAAFLSGGRRLAGARHLLESWRHKPRLRGPLQAFWERSDQIPEDVRTRYRHMLARTGIRRRQGARNPARAALVLKEHKPAGMAIVTRWFAPFAAAHPDARLVTFADGVPAQPAGNVAIEGWRGLLPYATYVKLWQAAYDATERFFRGLDKRASRLLHPFYHLVADQHLKTAVLQLADAGDARPLAFILPPEFAFCRRGLGFDASLQQRLTLLGQPLDVSSRRLGRIAGGLTRALLRRRPLARLVAVKHRAPPASRTAASRKRGILLVVEDTQSGLYRTPAIKIATTLSARDDTRVVAVTANAALHTELTSLGVATVLAHPFAQPASLARALPDARYLRRALAEVPGDMPPARNHELATCTLQGLAPQLAALDASYRAALEQAAARAPEVAAVLTLTESTPLALAALAWARERGLRTVGYWPSLLGDRPDAVLFTAGRHLVYGDQLRDLMIRKGVPAGTIRSVGSVSYDEALGRSRPDDIALVRQSILRRWSGGDKLVVIATEAMPRPLDEIGPVVAELLRLPDVHLVIKVHPSDSLELYQEFAAAAGPRDRIEVVGPCDLPALLHAADLLVCIMSNIILAAAQLGTPTLVCDFSNKRVHLDFVREGLATGCFDPAGLPAALGGLLHDSARRTEALERTRRALPRFNAGNDGLSHMRVVDELLRGCT